MEEIIQNLINEIEKNPNRPIEETISEILRKMNLKAEDVNEINAAFATLDSINKNALDLSEKKKNGMTRNGWIAEKLSQIPQKSEESEKIISQIEEGIQTAVDNTLSQDI